MGKLSSGSDLGVRLDEVEVVEVVVVVVLVVVGYVGESWSAEWSLLTVGL